jgi:hypothetical protein
MCSNKIGLKSLENLNNVSIFSIYWIIICFYQIEKIFILESEIKNHEK